MAAHDPLPWARDQSTSRDNADAQLEGEIRRQEALRHNFPMLSLFGQPRDIKNQLIDQLRNAEEEMLIFHQADIQRQEAIARTLTERIAEPTQEDQGSTMRIQELERQRDTVQAAVRHVNAVQWGLRPRPHMHMQ